MTARRSYRPRTAALLAVLLMPPLVLGCSAASSPQSKSSSQAPNSDSRVTAAPANVEKIASMTNCTVELRTEADELREGVCVTPQGNWIVTTFPAEKFKRSWLDAASMYGGTYLVGPRWAISGELTVLKTLRKKVGGELQELRGIGSPAPSDPSRASTDPQGQP
ncbi:hypothetical protein [Streptomyces sp. MnatMP-M17]|uniref:hypothetical protein n=1 Tax=unclassified Streptomyces TaxID=2593676 RepID=UPI00081E3878|nr:hypothetical protein [Streptomyces sp. MnatMP-M17]SCF90090.1 hypothetical protein GA0115259_104482 [Streptomyces sp. MnatMP-M17]